ncbi:STAS domain-containing protein [Pseudocolwellia sp. AS88]|nr:STAS domain-containing protein [Pseudocolwellia sp. AS88]MDO7084965.1 STAS domain-containing protein [Pseudocolwellia sp. AS88]
MFTLPKQLTITQIEECKASLLSYIDDNATVSINSDEIEKIDTLGIQLLLATIIYISAQNKELTWSSNSSVIQNSVKQLGLNEALLNQYINV